MKSLLKNLSNYIIGTSETLFPTKGERTGLFAASSLLVSLDVLLISSYFKGASWIVPMAFESKGSVSSVLTTSINFCFSRKSSSLLNDQKPSFYFDFEGDCGNFFASTGFDAVLL